MKSMSSRHLRRVQRNGELPTINPNENSLAESSGSEEEYAGVGKKLSFSLLLDEVEDTEDEVGEDTNVMTEEDIREDGADGEAQEKTPRNLLQKKQSPRKDEDLE